MSTASATDRATPAPTRGVPPFVDCDVHTMPASLDALRPYLPRRWRDHTPVRDGNPFGVQAYPKATPLAARVDTWPEEGVPGSDLTLMQIQHLDLYPVEYAVLNPSTPGGQRHLAWATAVARATNEWTASEWLDRDDRLRGSIVVAHEDPAGAAREIRRAAADPRFVQVYLLGRTNSPLGHPRYWPVYEAAAECGLPVGIHFGGYSATPITGAGWPSYYFEDHAGMPQAFQAHVTSLICEGVMEAIPDLRIVLIEGGVSWLPALAWRLDLAWERFGEEVPHLTRPPSSLIAERFWLTTQPIEEPERPRQFAEVMEAFPSLASKLMFSTDYPHWDFDAPDEALRSVRLPPGTLPGILRENAHTLYGLASGARP